MQMMQGIKLKMPVAIVSAFMTQTKNFNKLLLPQNREASFYRKLNGKTMLQFVQVQFIQNRI